MAVVSQASPQPRGSISTTEKMQYKYFYTKRTVAKIRRFSQRLKLSAAQRENHYLITILMPLWI